MTGPRWKSGIALSLALLMTCEVRATDNKSERRTAPPVQLEPVDLNHPPRTYVQQERQGWTVFVEQELADRDPETMQAALARLSQNLGRIAGVLPAARVVELRRLKIFLLYGPKATGGGRSNGLQYFRPGESRFHQWIDPRMESSVVVFSARNYLSLSELWAAKALVHEFGHAHHLEHWPEDRADIFDTWQAATKAGLYQEVRPADRSKHSPNYAAQNHLEYFAELTAAYYVGINYFPYDRRGLKQYDPGGYRLIRNLWEQDDIHEHNSTSDSPDSSKDR